jgi:hypothetical protein
MKALVLFIGFISSVFSLGAFAAKDDVTPGINQCAAVKDSKVYLTSEFHAYPRTVAFKCDYKCNANGIVKTLKGTSIVTVNNIDDDLTLPVCLGTILKKVPWGYDFDRINPFYAPDTFIKELKTWSFENINFNPSFNALEKDRLIQLKQELYMVSSTFIVSSMSAGSNAAIFREAGLKLSAIADGLPMDTKLLEEAIQQIVVNRGVSGTTLIADSLILPIIGNTAHWRVPVN